jgi:hypothetical protein
VWQEAGFDWKARLNKETTSLLEHNTRILERQSRPDHANRQASLKIQIVLVRLKTVA